MVHILLPALTVLGLLTLGAVGIATAQDCSGTITADETMNAEMVRYAA